MEPITLAEINATKLINTNAKKCAKSNLNYLNKKGKLFGSSLKVEKGADKFETLILYLQPADKVATETLCSFAELAGRKSLAFESHQLDCFFKVWNFFLQLLEGTFCHNSALI